MCLVTVQGDGKFEITQSKYRLTEDQKQDDGQKLFDFCAECLQTFISTSMSPEGSSQLQDGHKIPLGFTVSFDVLLERRRAELALFCASFHIPARESMSLLAKETLNVLEGKNASIMVFLFGGRKDSGPTIPKAMTSLRCSANPSRNT